METNKANADHVRTIVLTVTVLAEAFGRKTSEAMFEAYKVGLSGLSPEQLNRASTAALRSCKFMPSPAELRELSGELRTADRAEIAWQAFEQAVVRHGAYESIDFDDAVINATVLSLGGWTALCELESKEFDTFLRARFLKTYDAFARNGNGAGPLTGLIAKENALGGFPSPKPIRITTGLPALPHVRRRQIESGGVAARLGEMLRLPLEDRGKETA